MHLYMCTTSYVGMGANLTICIRLASYIVLIRLTQVDIRVVSRVTPLHLIASEMLLITFKITLECYDALLGVVRFSL